MFIYKILCKETESTEVIFEMNMARSAYKKDFLWNFYVWSDALWPNWGIVYLTHPESGWEKQPE